MWIVRTALNRPYTFLVLALLILLISPIVILRTPTDIFPNINIPVIAVIWNFAGLNPEELEGRMTSVFERVATTTVNDIEHLESFSLNGTAVVKIFLQPYANVTTGLAQTTAVGQTILRQMPQGVNPPLILTYNASSVPIIQLALSGKGLQEQDLNDIALNFLRTQLVTVPGAVVPYPYGGKTRQVMIDLNQAALQSKGLSPMDVVTAINQQNLILPSGTAKIGQFEYDVDMNASPKRIDEINSFPIRAVGNSVIYVRDVANVRNGFAPQTNVVRRDGSRGVLVSVLKAGSASTLDVVQGVKDILPKVAATLPAALRIRPLADQSIFVRAAINGVVREAIIAACLTGLMILLFLGSWRSTLIIAISIPLSILTSVCILSALGETINIMTLGGLALAVGILVDDATVTIENIERFLEEGLPLHEAILDGAAQISVPALVSTLCICIVFLPMFFLSGVAKYLFVPLAEAVVFAMIASYILSRTLVPTLAMYLLRAKHGVKTRNPLVLFQRGFERIFDRVRAQYEAVLTTLVYRRKIFVPVFLLVCVAAMLLVPVLGRDFFPTADTGQFKLHVRAKTGTRIEETARLCDLIDQSIRRQIPKAELETVLDNIGLPFSSINLTYSNSGQIGSADADILVTLAEKHRPTADYVRTLRTTLPRQFPGTTFYLLPADIVTQILNFGLPAPIDVQIVGNNVEQSRAFADRLLPQMRQIPGAVDLHIHQVFDGPKLHIQVDRTKAAQIGLTQNDVARNMLNTLSGSLQTQPTFWLNPQNGVSYSMVAQTPQYDIQSLQDLHNIPVTPATTSVTANGPVKPPEIMSDIADITRTSEMGIVTHYNIRRTIDIYGSVQDRDLGGVGTDLQRVIDNNRKYLPRGSDLIVRGQVQTMQSSFIGLLAGLAGAIVLVYLLIVVNFQSWVDPFIIITALPAALAGIVLFLFVTHTTISVPALMGAIMCMGVATANSILVVSFAKEHLEIHGDAIEASLRAGSTRFRPVLMTALAMIIGMVPMAMGLGEGGEQNAPLGRAVIGGLLCATVATLFFVPSVFGLIHKRLSESRILPGKPVDAFHA
ncbi:MAG TPA: efflux RND transporter permease subunit [Bryobacteraceae bacterium]|jgi:multidrug efflux pump subunit AcrB|nr:efflux RND transporter permease subunit [Bryobacteraceae bacterium]